MLGSFNNSSSSVAGSQSEGGGSPGSTGGGGGSKEEMRAKALMRKSKASMSTSKMSNALTSHMQQQAILAQAMADESTSTEAHSSHAHEAFLKGGGDESALKGEEQLKIAMSKEKNAENLRRTIGVMGQTKMGVSRRALMRAVMEDERQFKTCMTLPMTMLFSMLFIAFFQLHYGTHLIYLQESAIRDSIGEAPFEAETAEDIFDWMSGTLFPWLWTIPNVGGPGSDSPGSVALHQKLSAGVQVFTARGPSVDCAYSLKGDKTPCYAKSPATAVQDLPPGWQEAGRRLSAAPSWHSSSLGRLLGMGPTSNVERVAARAAARARKAERLARDGWQAPVGSRSRQLSAPARLAAKARERAAKGGLPGPTRRLEGGSLNHAQEAKLQRRLTKMISTWHDPVINRKDGPTYVNTIPMSMSLPEVQAVIANFSNPFAPLVDDSTLFFGIEFDLLSDKTQQAGVLTHCKVEFMMSRGGSMLTKIMLTTMVLDLKFTAMGVLGLFTIALLRLTIVTLMINCIAAKHGAWRTDVFRFSNFIDVFISIYGWVIIAAVFIETMGARSFTSSWDTYEVDRLATPFSELQAYDQDNFAKLQDQINFPRAVANEQISLVANYQVLLVVRFLIATMGHPRLAIIMRTLLHGMGDLLHLFFVFLLIFLAYVMSGHILMGPRMPELATFKGSFGYCLRIVLAREYEYTRITEENMITAALWIITFVLLLVLVTVNMMLAMIFDNYGEVRENVFKNETIFAFFKRLLTQLQMQSSWISNTEMLKKLASMPPGTSCTLKQVQTDFPDITTQQLQLIFDHASQKQQQQIFSANRNQIPEHIAGLLVALRDVREGVRRMNKNGTRREGSQGGSTINTVIDNDEGKGMNNLPKNALKPPQPVTAPKSTPAEEGKPEGGELDDASVHEIAQEGNDSDSPDNGGAPPTNEPDWVEGGLLNHLKLQQQSMEVMLKQMDSMRKSIAKRGIKGAADFKKVEPTNPELSYLAGGSGEERLRSRSQSPAGGAAETMPLVNRPRRTYEIRDQRPGQREPGTPRIGDRSRSSSSSPKSS